jgi:hypothetical protein
MNKQKSQKKKNNTNKTLKHKNLVGGYGIKTKSNRRQTDARTRKQRRKLNNRMLREGEGGEEELEDDNQEEYTIPPEEPVTNQILPEYGPVQPYSQPEIPPVPPYVPPTPYGDVQSYIPPPAFEPIPPYVQPAEIPPVQPYVPPPAFEPIPPFQNSLSSEEQVTSPVIPQETIIPQEETTINQEDYTIPPEEPVTKPSLSEDVPPPAFEPIPAYIQPSEIPPVQPYVPPPAFEPIPAYVQPSEIPPVQPSEIPPVQPYVPPPAFEPIPPFQNPISSEEQPEEPVINQKPQSETNAEDFKNGFTETIIQNNQPQINNNINVDLCPTLIEVGKNINHKYMFPSQFPVITNFYKQIPENMINNNKSI